MIVSGNAPSAYGDKLYRKLNAHQDALAAQGVDYDERRAQIKAEKAVIDAELEQRWPRVWRAYNTSSMDYGLHDVLLHATSSHSKQASDFTSVKLVKQEERDGERTEHCTSSGGWPGSARRFSVS